MQKARLRVADGLVLVPAEAGEMVRGCGGKNFK